MREADSNEQRDCDDTEDFDIGKYLEAISENLAGPLPLFLGRMDGILDRLITHLDHPEYLSSARMLMLAFGSMRAATALTIAGASPQVPVIVRHALESALYGYLFFKDRKFYEHWRNRETNKKSKHIFRTEGLRKAKEYVKSYDKGLGQAVTEQLNVLVDFGAHPNPFQVAELVTHHFDVGSEDGRERFGVLTGADHQRSSFSLLVPGYVNVIRIYEAIWPEKFAALVGRPSLASALRQFHVYRSESS